MRSVKGAPGQATARTTVGEAIAPKRHKNNVWTARGQSSDDTDMVTLISPPRIAPRLPAFAAVIGLCLAAAVSIGPTVAEERPWSELSLAQIDQAPILQAQADTPLVSPFRGASPSLDSAARDTSKVDCTCRPPGGGKAPVGAEICVKRGDEQVTMRCEMVLNNTIWRELHSGCGPEPLS